MAKRARRLTSLTESEANMLTSVWDFIKQHWQAILLVMVVIGGYAWIRHQQAGFTQALQQVNAAHQVELDSILKAKSIEDTQHAQELQQLQQSLATIQTQYDLAQKQLQQNQKTEQQDIVKKYGNDADGLAKLMADKLGLVVVSPAYTTVTP